MDSLCQELVRTGTETNPSPTHTNVNQASVHSTAQIWRVRRGWQVRGQPGHSGVACPAGGRWPVARQQLIAPTRGLQGGTI